ncbi:SAP-like protein BP-73 isoform X1 [Quercus lobata]|uniref:SAP-like protein BP-73 isoform X1 n=1 Tax=Quercus lobata TaxID=97700 RepID=UPI0012484316|nr:SAP-like protein BP-73 isoform X1 [Quercus lobata]
MNAVVFVHSYSTLVQFPFFLSFSRQSRLGKRISSLKETADGPSLFDSQNDFCRLTVSSIRSDENGRRSSPWRSSASRRTSEDDNETPQSSNGEKSNSSNQEEIIAMFRRIQSAISKDDSVKTKRNSNLSEDKTSPESILEILRKSRKQVKGDADKTSNKEGYKVLTRRRGVAKKKEQVQKSPLVGNLKPTRLPSKFVKRSPIPSPSTPRERIPELNNEAYLKPTRLPSKFVKRSPIPSPSTPRERILELNNEASQASAGRKELKLPRIEEMKLTELKDLAKSRGFKGYSKLKKSELIELLRS